MSWTISFSSLLGKNSDSNDNFSYFSRNTEDPGGSLATFSIPFAYILPLSKIMKKEAQEGLQGPQVLKEAFIFPDSFRNSEETTAGSVKANKLTAWDQCFP